MSKNLNVRPYNNKELLLFPASIGDYLSKDDLAHVVDEAVDEIDLGPYYDKISDVGNPPYHPALMVKIWFYGYATKTYSSRKIEEKLHKDVAFIYLAGMQKPDFKAISEFRRKNLSELRNSFVDILQIGHRLGMIRLGEIALDSKVMKANASADRTYNEKKLIKEREEIQKAIEEYLEKVNQTDLEEDQKYGPDKRGNELPEDIRKKEDRIKKMKQIVEQLKQAQKKLKNSGKKKINLTDNEAQFQKDKSRIIPGYRAQVAVDSKEQVIVVNDVASEPTDPSQLVPMADEVIKNVKKLKKAEQGLNKKHKIKLIADSSYNSGPNLDEIEKRKSIDSYIPDNKYQAKERGHKTDEDSPFHGSKFIFNKEENCFICPDRRKVNFIKEIKHHGKPYLLYRCLDCKDCKYFAKCTTDKKGRSIRVSKYKHLIYKMREKLSTKRAKEIYALRKITVEPVLGNLSQNLGFREFLLRGLYKVKGEFSLMCIAHNLLKIAKLVRGLGITLKEALSMEELLAIADSS